MGKHQLDEDCVCGVGGCQEVPTHLIIRFMELYQDGKLMSPDHEIYEEALVWVCAAHVVDWQMMEPQVEVVPLTG